MKKLCAIMAILLIISTALCGCGKGETDENLVGSWACSSDGVRITMTFEEDGSGSFSMLYGLITHDFTYNTKNGTLYLEADEDASDDISFNKAEYTINGNSLTIDDGTEILNFTKEISAN